MSEVEKMFTDCPKCGVRFERTFGDPEKKCARCVIMSGTDVAAILAELKKTKIPGQEPILRLFELLNDKIEAGAKRVAVANIGANGKT